jgi:hypothetical protein
MSQVRGQECRDRNSPRIRSFAYGRCCMSLGLILVIILVIFLLGGFSGRFSGYGYGYGHRGASLGRAASR